MHLLKAVQNIRIFLGTVSTACHVTPQNTFFCAIDLLLDLLCFWTDTVANQVFDLLALKSTLGIAKCRKHSVLPMLHVGLSIARLK